MCQLLCIAACVHYFSCHVHCFVAERTILDAVCTVLAAVCTVLVAVCTHVLIFSCCVSLCDTLTAVNHRVTTCATMCPCDVFWWQSPLANILKSPLAISS